MVTDMRCYGTVMVTDYTVLRFCRGYAPCLARRDWGAILRVL